MNINCKKQSGNPEGIFINKKYNLNEDSFEDNLIFVNFSSFIFFIFSGVSPCKSNSDNIFIFLGLYSAFSLIKISFTLFEIFISFSFKKLFNTYTERFVLIPT